MKVHNLRLTACTCFSFTAVPFVTDSYGSYLLQCVSRLFMFVA